MANRISAYCVQRVALLAACFALLSGSVPAAWGALATYDFNSNSSPTIGNPDIVASDPIGMSGGWSRAGSGNAWLASVTGTDEASAITEQEYLTITVAPTAGHVVNLSSLSFNYGYDTQTSIPADAGDDSYTYFVQSDVSGSFATLPASTVSISSGTNRGRTIIGPHTITLGSAFENLTDPVTFHLAVYYTSGSFNSLGNARYDSIVLDGTTGAIPEPASLALLGVGGLLMFSRRRGSPRGGEGVRN